MDDGRQPQDVCSGGKEQPPADHGIEARHGLPHMLGLPEHHQPATRLGIEKRIGRYEPGSHRHQPGRETRRRHAADDQAEGEGEANRP